MKLTRSHIALIVVILLIVLILIGRMLPIVR